jgi:outer membrane protein TolC
MKRVAYLVLLMLLRMHAQAQTPDANAPLQFARPQGAGAPPAVITLQDALERARKVDISVQLALAEAEIAREEAIQARASTRPSLTHTTEYLGTQGNGITPNGRFVAADGVHVYRSLATVRQEISPNTILKTETHRAAAAEALAQAKAEIARRGLDVTVARRYYALVVAQRHFVTAQQAVQQSQRFVEITTQQENAGQAAHSDVIKAQIQLQQHRQAFQEASLAIENSRLELAIVLSPTLDENFSVIDDLDSARNLPSFDELRALAERENPALKAADASLRQASFNVRTARNALLPSLSVEGNYGIEANAFKLHSTQAADPSVGPLPNLGYSFTLHLAIPVFDWGTSRSKVRQAQARERQAGLELTQAQREIASNLYSLYNEAIAARAAVDLARGSADLASESLRLINLRYQAGESSVLEVVDAQSTLVEARNT